MTKAGGAASAASPAPAPGFQPSPPPRPPYFEAFHYSLWDVIDYLEYTLAESHISDAVFHRAADSYTKSLEAIATSPLEKWQKAQDLLKNYKQGEDRQRARDWRDKHRGEALRHRKDSSPSLVISNSQVAIGDNARVNINPKPTSKSKIKHKSRLKPKSKGKGKGKRTLDDVVGPEAAGQSGWSPSSFVRMYSKMEERFMWKLPSGSFVETVIHDKLKDADQESLGHSFVLDVKNTKVKDWFDPPDWDAILTKVPAWPTIDSSAVEFMREFSSVQTAKSLRERLAAISYLPPGEQYDREKHYDRYWIHMIITMLLPLFENPDKPLLCKNDECWYDIRIWGIIIDTILDEINGLNTRRRELPTLAGANRKNRHRDDTSKRQRIGARFDGLVQDGVGRYEYAAIEGSKEFVSERNTKWLHDHHKVAKALHDMLYSLQSEVGNDVATLEKLHLAGIVNAGLHCQVLRMTYASGYVCLLSCDSRCQVPQTPSELSLLFQLLSSVLRMKKMLTDSKALIDNYPSTRSFDQLVQPAKLTTTRLIIPMSCDTECEGSEST